MRNRNSTEDKLATIKALWDIPVKMRKAHSNLPFNSESRRSVRPAPGQEPPMEYTLWYFGWVLGKRGRVEVEECNLVCVGECNTTLCAAL